MLALQPVLEQTGGRPVLVGFSGGLDSTALLHLLATSSDVAKPGLRAIHVNHGLHPDADAWGTHCQRICDDLDVPLTIALAEVVHGRGDGLEAAARKARHEAFEAELRGDEILALAHHRDDQAETFLLRALRASGPDGLGAMRAWRRFDRGWLWRPLLDVPRSELLAHARQHELQWIEDSSNANTALDRNFLRHRVLPLLRERWPHADAAFARSAMLSAEASELLCVDDGIALGAVRGSDPHLIDIGRLRDLPMARRAGVLRRWIVLLGLPPLPAHGIKRIEADLLAAAPDSGGVFAWSGVSIRRWRGWLHADAHRPGLSPDWRAPWDGRETLQLPTGDSLQLDGPGDACFDPPLRVRARGGGERITLPGRSHSHTLKHVLQDCGVPPWLRTRLPLLSTDDGELLAAGDVVISARLTAWLREHEARLVWSRVL